MMLVEEIEYTFTVDDIPVYIDFTGHADLRSVQRQLNKSVVFDILQEIGDRLLDMKSGTEFAIVHPEYFCTVIGCIYSQGTDVVLDIITVLNEREPYIKQGTEVLHVM